MLVKVRAAIVLVLLALLPSVAHAEGRFALLIGNQSYDPSVGVLKNPHNDNAAGAGAIGFIYYSSHGAAEKDTNINYRIPVDAKKPGSTASWDESVKLDEVTIAKSFAVGRFAVTRGEFAAFVAATGHKTNGVAMRALNGSKMLNAIGARLASHAARKH
jgi:Sulfatase-modifying factor enzyme 1